MGKFAMISPWSRDETPSGISAPLLDETSRGLGASITISEHGITGVRIVPVYLGSSGRPKMLEPGAPHHAEILRIVAERTQAAGPTGSMSADGEIDLSCRGFLTEPVAHQDAAALLARTSTRRNSRHSCADRM